MQLVDSPPAVDGWPLYHLIVHPSNGEWLETPIRVPPKHGFGFESDDLFDLKWGDTTRTDLAHKVIICPSGLFLLKETSAGY